MTPESSIKNLLQSQMSEDNWRWLSERAAEIRKEDGSQELRKTFSLVSRKVIIDKVVRFDKDDVGSDLANLVNLGQWKMDRTVRVWLLLQVDVSDKSKYLSKIDSLFEGASVNESVALFSALPLLAYSLDWKLRCAEGIRSNIGSVLEAIMYENVYPLTYLEEPAWNQMILKAFFTDKQVDRIWGLDQRANQSLANVLIDYAHERWAAHRSVNPQLWRLIGKFIDASNFSDIQRLFQQGDGTERKAALLACCQSDYPPAKLLLDSLGEIKNAINDKKLNWNTLEMKQNN